LLAAGFDHHPEITPHALLQTLRNALSRRAESLGARECHAFDARMVVDSKPPLKLVDIYKLFQDSSQWDDGAYGKFVFEQVRRSLSQQGSALAARSDALPMLRTAERLTEGHCDHYPDDDQAKERLKEIKEWIGNLSKR
jgi:hypothetical protein